MRVLFGHQRFGVQPFGGISRYFFELAAGLSRIEGVHAGVFAPLHVNHYLRGSPLLEPWGFHAPPFPGSGLPLGALNLALSKLLVERRRDVDVYHETYYTRFDSKPRGAIRVLTVFDMIHELYPESFRSHDMTRQVKAKAIARADHLICISESTRRDLIRVLNVPPERTSVVYLGTSLGVRESVPTFDRSGRPFLLYVGARGGYKNFSNLVRAYASSSRLRQSFRIVCFGGGGISADESRLFGELGLAEGDVRQVTGPDRALQTAYSRAAMLVYPSMYEGFGLPPIEAMSLGCAVVCADSSSIPEIVGAAGQYFDPSSPEDMRRAIEELTDSPSRIRELVELGRHRAAQFSWDLCASKTLDVYRRLTGRDRDAPAVH